MKGAMMEPVVMEQMEMVRTDSVSPTSTSDSTEVDYQLKFLSVILKLQAVIILTGLLDISLANIL